MMRKASTGPARREVRKGGRDLRPEVKLGPDFEKALALALRVHGDDARKGKTVPYVSHLLGVASLVLADGGSEEEAIAALLHDTLEDHPELVTRESLRESFGDTVLEIVVSCTDTPADYEGGEKPDWRARKQTYLDHLAHATPGGRRVSLADKLYNARDLLADVRREGPSTWARFNAGPQEQLWYHRSILEAMRAAGQAGVLVEEYEVVVESLASVVEPGAGR